jgi:hypothetical protein
LFPGNTPFSVSGNESARVDPTADADIKLTRIIAFIIDVLPPGIIISIETDTGKI